MQHRASNRIKSTVGTTNGGDLTPHKGKRWADFTLPLSGAGLAQLLSPTRTMVVPMPLSSVRERGEPQFTSVD